MSERQSISEHPENLQDFHDIDFPKGFCVSKKACGESAQGYYFLKGNRCDMGKFNRKNLFNKKGSRRSGEGESRGRRGRGRERSSDRRDSGRRPDMHRVTCDRCGKECEVPFKPTSNKPVYCSDCFRKERKSGSESSGDYKKEFEQINEKLNKIMKSLRI